MNILSLSGFVPEAICDTVRFTGYTGERNIAHYCGYTADYISQVMNDHDIDGAVFPKTCDSTRTLMSYLSGSGKFCFQFVPPSDGTPSGVEFYANQIRTYKRSVEAFYGITLGDIPERMEMVNERNKLILGAYERLSSLSYFEYLSAIHGMLKLPLKEQKTFGKAGPLSPQKRIDMTGQRSATKEKRVFIVGSFLSCLQIAKDVEAAGLNVAGDSLPESGRLVSARPMDPEGDPYLEIAAHILSMRHSPTQNSFRGLISRDISEIEEKNVNGVIFVIQKYCEPYEYLYPVYKKELDKRGISSVKISPDHSEDRAKAVLLLEAFADKLQEG